ncbi:MAG TPA: M1 family metallopeptidase [Acidimicrobiales bacterium]
MSANPHRLPRTVTPARSDLTLTPDLPAATFAGQVDIELDVTEAVDQLVCNALELEIDAGWLLVDNGEGGADLVDITGFHVDPDAQRLTITLDETVAGGSQATLHLEFRGVLNDKLRGFYRSTFTDTGGVERVIATTQMQATDCRRAFPCWDEPDFKAVFGITLIVDDELLAVSNEPEAERRRIGDGKALVRFHDTMVMSTYLVAFVVGPLEATAAVDVDGVPLRVVHVPGKEGLTAFALEVGAFALRWYQRYYDIPYPGRKVDLIALPDFAAGAMENIGCITFRENLLLVDPQRATTLEEQTVADVVCHELAHMWFGDLVTMRWWNGIWLNEAFATFMEIAACDAFRSEWERWVSFGLERTAAFETDSLTSTRAVEYEVVSPKDAEGMFDVLTYQKGGALLRMLEQYLGVDRFRDGIRHYLLKHSYGNTETSDLWDALEATTGEPVRRIMDSWIWQGGHPVVSATVSGDHLVLSQRRFLFGADDDGTRWAIPVKVRQDHGGRIDECWVLLDGDELRVPMLHRDALVVVNAGGYGFYRVDYSPALLQRIVRPTLQRLTTPERYGVADDAWAAVVAGWLGADDFVRFSSGFADETEPAIWQTLLNGLRWCDRFVEGEARDELRTRLGALVSPALDRLGWEPQPGENARTSELRGMLIRALAVTAADTEARARAHDLHIQAVADPESVAPEVAAACLGVVAATGTADDYEQLLARFRSAPTPQEALRSLYALADFPDASLVQRTLELALSGEVRTQNAPFLLARCILHRDHGAQAWTFVREHWAQCTERFPDNTIVRMVQPVSSLTRPQEQADVAAFFAEHPIPQATKTLQQVLERQRVNVGLRERSVPSLEAELHSPG